MYHTKPTGGLYIGRRLQQPPSVNRVRADAPARIVFVTDLHLRRRDGELLKNTLNAVIALKPQLLLLGGDIAEYDGGCDAFFEALAPLVPEYGAYAVPGNNDDPRFSKDRAALAACMAKGGVRLLLNRCVRIPAAGRAIALAGVEDSYSHTPNATGLFAGCEGDYRILLSHAPHAFLLGQAAPAPHLMLSGHTHGGQINLCGLTCYELLRYEHWYRFTHISGVKRVGDTLCVVSNGVGISKYPLRLGARPEIHLIT